MYCILFYQLKDDYLERRGEYRPEHLALAKTMKEEGKLVMADALADPANEAVLVFKGDDALSSAKAFAEADPYVANGLVASWSVRKWTVVVGGDNDL